MAVQSKTITEITLQSLIKDLQLLSHAAKNVREKLLMIFPAKPGSELWWEKQTLDSIRDYSQKKYKSFSSVKDLIKDLDH